MAQSEADDSHWDSVSYVIASRYRVMVLEELTDRPGTPSKLSERTGLDSVAHVSRALRQLREHDIAELLVSEDRKKGRVYGLTDRGEEIIDDVLDTT